MWLQRNSKNSCRLWSYKWLHTKTSLILMVQTSPLEITSSSHQSERLRSSGRVSLSCYIGLKKTQTSLLVLLLQQHYSWYGPSQSPCLRQPTQETVPLITKMPSGGFFPLIPKRKLFQNLTVPIILKCLLISSLNLFTVQLASICSGTSAGHLLKLCFFSLVFTIQMYTANDRSPLSICPTKLHKPSPSTPA